MKRTLLFLILCGVALSAQAQLKHSPDAISTQQSPFSAAFRAKAYNAWLAILDIEGDRPEEEYALQKIEAQKAIREVEVIAEIKAEKHLVAELHDMYAARRLCRTENLAQNDQCYAKTTEIGNVIWTELGLHD